jgi:hypothetical protein
MQAMKVHGGVEVSLYSFLTLILNGDGVLNVKY